MKFKVKTAFIAGLIAMCLPLPVVCEAAESLNVAGGWTVRLSAGGFMSRGLHVHREDVAPAYGIQGEWNIDESFNLRLGYEHIRPGVDDNSDLRISRIPFLLVSNVRESGPFQDFYYGAGVIHSVTHYTDGHFPDVGKGGPAAFAGYRLTDKWHCELMFNHMKKHGREYGGYTLNFTYELF